MSRRFDPRALSRRDALKGLAAVGGGAALGAASMKQDHIGYFHPTQLDAGVHRQRSRLSDGFKTFRTVKHHNTRVIEEANRINQLCYDGPIIEHRFLCAGIAKRNRGLENLEVDLDGLAGDSTCHVRPNRLSFSSFDIDEVPNFDGRFSNEENVENTIKEFSVEMMDSPVDLSHIGPAISVVGVGAGALSAAGMGVPFLAPALFAAGAALFLYDMSWKEEVTYEDDNIRIEYDWGFGDASKEVTCYLIDFSLFIEPGANKNFKLDTVLWPGPADDVSFYVNIPSVEGVHNYAGLPMIQPHHDVFSDTAQINLQQRANNYEMTDIYREIPGTNEIEHENVYVREPHTEEISSNATIVHHGARDEIKYELTTVPPSERPRPRPASVGITGPSTGAPGEKQEFRAVEIFGDEYEFSWSVVPIGEDFTDFSDGSGRQSFLFEEPGDYKIGLQASRVNTTNEEVESFARTYIKIQEPDDSGGNGGGDGDDDDEDSGWDRCDSEDGDDDSGGGGPPPGKIQSSPNRPPCAKK